MPNFTHLHVHTHYSLLDGLGKIDQLLEKAKILAMDALAITDHGNMYGVIEFYRKAKKAGVKPIIGCELYIAPRRMTDKTGKIDTAPYHLAVLAKNRKGYLNLIQLVTAAHLQGYYYKPRIDKELLKKHSEGLIALSACLQGEIPRLLLSDNFKAALKTAKDYEEIFGKGNFYLEMQDHPNINDQKKANKGLKKLAAETAIPLVATSDVHYVDPGDAEAQDILLCVQTNKTVEDKDRISMLNDDFSLKTQAQMEKAFADTPEAIENTQKIADQCNLEIEFADSILPDFRPPENLSREEYLKKLAFDGLAERYGIKSKLRHPAGSELRSQASEKEEEKELVERLEYELGVIEKTGFASYFLIVADIVNWAKDQEIFVGPGRGSAAGSLVAYVLKITDIDPIKHNLLFERFLNPERISMPDIDLDFADDRRGEVIQYMVEKYGEDKVAQIVTFGTMAARNATRDCGRALGLGYSFVDRIAKMIPFNMNLEQSLRKVPELRDDYQKDPQVKKLIDLAKKLEGVVRHASTHAAGVVIGDKALTNYLPLQKATKGELSSLTQYSMYDLEEMGLLKMDILGLANLSIIQNAIKIIAKTQNKKINLDEIPEDDLLTFSLLSRGETTGVFQLESEGMKRYLKELKPSNFEDIISMVALYRPGPMESIPDFIDGKHGRKKITYLHPTLKPILERTYGVIVTQEQVLEIARELAGFTYGEADILRKAVGKKIKKLLSEQQEKFINGAVKNKVDKKIAKKVWDFIEPFAQYGFNKSHAACYGLIAYWTAFLKAHYPSEFMAALLTSDQNNIDRITIEVTESQRMGLSILPADVNESFENFTVLENGDIRFGLGAVKNVGTGAIAAIVEGRKKGGSFKDLEDFCKKVDFSQVNKKVLGSLAKSGALDAFGERGQMLIGVEAILKYANQLQKRDRSGQVALFDTTGADFAGELDLPEIEKVDERQRLSWERELLGVYISGHPLKEFAKYLDQNSTPISKLNNDHDGRRIKVGGMITKVQKIITKKGDPMVFATLEDKTTSVEILVFPGLLAENPSIWRQDNVVLVSGKVNLRDGQLKVLADKVREVGSQMSLEGEEGKEREPSEENVARAGSESLYLKIPKVGTKEMLTKLKKVLLKFVGEGTVVLLLPQDGGFKKVKIKSKVEICPGLLDELKNLLSSESVQVR